MVRHSAQCLLLSVWICGWMFSLTPLHISFGQPVILLQAVCLLRPLSWDSCLVASLLQPWGGPLTLCPALGDISTMVSVTLLFHLKQQYSKCPHLNGRFFLTGYESCPVSPTFPLSVHLVMKKVYKKKWPSCSPGLAHTCGQEVTVFFSQDDSEHISLTLNQGKVGRLNAKSF